VLLPRRSGKIESEDFFTIQDAITRLAIDSLRIALPDDAQTVLSFAESNVSIDAYVLCRRGMNQLFQPISDQMLAAEVSCKTALTVSPNLPVVPNAPGDLYMAVGEVESGKHAYQAALDFDENNAIALLSLANAYAREMNPEQAERTYRRATAVQPGNWRSYNSLGWFFFQNGRYKEAAENAFKEARAFCASQLDKGPGLDTVQRPGGYTVSHEPEHGKANRRTHPAHLSVSAF
jgi:Tfp pilus assembly protein PilF